MPDLNVMIARSGDGNDGFYLAAKGGHNDESHNHNDVGNFIVYYDGRPVLIDAGAQTYTRKTFSSRRYELWNNQSAYHNVPTINGVLQQDGAPFAAKNVRYKANEKQVRFSLDIADAYPKEAQVKSWKRSLALNRGRNVELEEAYTLNKFVEPFSLNFLTPIAADVSRAGVILFPFDGEMLTLKYDKRAFDARIETIAIEDSRLGRSWGDELYRIVLTSKNKDISGDFRIKIEK